MRVRGFGRCPTGALFGGCDGFAILCWWEPDRFPDETRAVNRLATEVPEETRFGRCTNTFEDLEDRLIPARRKCPARASLKKASSIGPMSSAARVWRGRPDKFSSVLVVPTLRPDLHLVTYRPSEAAF